MLAFASIYKLSYYYLFTHILLLFTPTRICYYLSGEHYMTDAFISRRLVEGMFIPQRPNQSSMGFCPIIE